MKSRVKSEAEDQTLGGRTISGK